MFIRTLSVSVLALALIGPAPALGAERVANVSDFDAKPDGTTLSTAPIQKAIDHCAAEGGGTVRFPPGKWLCGAISLRSNVTLLLEEGATLLGSPNLDDYVVPASSAADRPKGERKTAKALITCEQLRQVAIRGKGTIDGNGAHFRDKTKPRPKVLMFTGCQDVRVEGVRLQASGSWMQHYRDCERLVVRDVTVFNHASFNNDGLDVDSCRDVEIADCTIDSDDDALCLKSLSDRPCRNVKISNCTLSSHCNAIKMGTESGGGFQDITVRDCRVFSPRHSKVIYGKQRGLAGIALEIVDGGLMDGVDVSNIEIDGVTAPVFIRLGNRGRAYENRQAKPGIGTLRNVTLSKITATKASSTGCSITGLPGHPVENVVLKDIQLTFDGGESRQRASAEVPERPESYPECTMFGTLPAYGLYCRHVKGLKLSRVQLRTDKPDQRHAVVCDDAEEVRIEGLDAPFSVEAAALVRLTDAKQVAISGCKPEAAGGVFVRVEGKGSREVDVSKNDFSRVTHSVEKADDVADDAVRSEAKPAP